MSGYLCPIATTTDELRIRSATAFDITRERTFVRFSISRVLPPKNS